MYPLGVTLPMATRGTPKNVNRMEKFSITNHLLRGTTPSYSKEE